MVTELNIHTKELNNNTNFPDELTCPIMYENMVNPYICIDGYTYEYINTLKLIKSPFTRQKLDKSHFRPNLTIKLFVELYELIDLNWYLNQKFYYCPITKEIMKKPVIWTDGLSYEKMLF